MFRSIVRLPGRSPFGGQPRRDGGHMVPATQYDIPVPKRLNLIYCMIHNYEIVPIIATCAFSMIQAFVYCLYMTGSKVDVTYSHRQQDTISRNMDLQNPTCHKMITVNQEYRPWLEMKSSLEKMRLAEKAWEARQGRCP